jgi:hypothetical protein
MEKSVKMSNLTCVVLWASVAVTILFLQWIVFPALSLGALLPSSIIGVVIAGATLKKLV